MSADVPRTLPPPGMLSTVVMPFSRATAEIAVGVVHDLGALVRVHVPGLLRVVGALDGRDLLEPEHRVRMHEAGIDVLARAVHDLRTRRYGHRRTDGGDLAAVTTTVPFGMTGPLTGCTVPPESTRTSARTGTAKTSSASPASAAASMPRVFPWRRFIASLLHPPASPADRPRP
jgi:hypothetical protein